MGYSTLAALFSHIPASALEEVCAEALRLQAQAARQGTEVSGRDFLPFKRRKSVQKWTTNKKG